MKRRDGRERHPSGRFGGKTREVREAQESRSPRPGVRSWGAEEGDGSGVESKSLRRRSQAGRFDWEARERKRGRKLLLDSSVGEKL